MNSITLVGRIGRDVELKSTSTGKTFCTFSVAVPKRIKPTNGDPDADWFNVKVWGKTADYVTGYLAKGSLVSISGRMESRKYTDKEGNNRELWEVAADQVNGLDKKTDGGTKPNTTQSTGGNGPLDHDPFEDD
jgi:single-strand DNA-binding protein